MRKRHAPSASQNPRLLPPSGLQPFNRSLSRLAADRAFGCLTVFVCALLYSVMHSKLFFFEEKIEDDDKKELASMTSLLVDCMHHMIQYKLGTFSYSGEDDTLMTLLIHPGSGETIKHKTSKRLGKKEGKGYFLSKTLMMVTGIAVGQTAERIAIHNVWGMARDAGMNPVVRGRMDARTGGVKELTVEQECQEEKKT